MKPKEPTTNQDVVSFVLRFVREASEEQDARWRGTVKHVQGSTERQFSKFSEALGFMQNHMNEVVKSAFKDGSDLGQFNPVLETARLWGEFLPQYNRLIISSMTEAAAQSATFPRQLEHAMEQMFHAEAASSVEEKNKGLEEKIQTLTEQVKGLTDIVRQLQQEVTRFRDQDEA